MAGFFAGACWEPITAAWASTITIPAYGIVLNAGTAVTQRQKLNFVNSGCSDNAGTQSTDCTFTSSSAGGGITVFSGAAAIAGTLYFPIGGGSLPSSTESIAATFSPSTSTVTNFYVNVSAALGIGNSIVFTWRDNAASQSLTCTITGAVATSCNDTTHSFTATAGHSIAIQAVVGGVIAGTPNLVMSAVFGTTGATGTVNTGATGQVAYYAAGGTTVSGIGPGTTTTLLHGNAAGAPSFGAVTASDMAVVNTRRTACMAIGANNGSVLADADLGPFSRYFFFNAAATIQEIEVAADGGTPNVIVGRSRAGSIANLTSSALATAAAGGIACSNGTGAVGLDGATTCSNTLQNTGINIGDWLTLVSGTAGGVAKEMTVCVTSTVN